MMFNCFTPPKLSITQGGKRDGGVLHNQLYMKHKLKSSVDLYSVISRLKKVRNVCLHRFQTVTFLLSSMVPGLHENFSSVL